MVSIAARRSGPVQTLDRSGERRLDCLRQLIGTHRRGTRRLEAECRPDGERHAPRPGRVVGRDDRRQPHLQPAGVLEDQPGEGAGNGRPEAGQGRLG